MVRPYHIPLALCKLALLPCWYKQAFQLIEDRGEGEADQRDHDETDVHRVYRENLPGVPDHVAEAALRADHFGDRDQDQAHPRAEFDARHDERQRPEARSW